MTPEYLSHSRENFSNIVLSVPSGNGISIHEDEVAEDGGAKRARQTSVGRRRRARINTGQLLYRPASTIFYCYRLFLLPLPDFHPFAPLQSFACVQSSHPPSQRLPQPRVMSIRTCVQRRAEVALTRIGPPSLLEAETVAPNHCSVLLSI
ncbi:hypothetical protein ALC56_15028 [Trachymyrmex septentrionalis]|uniref:Uncharacterized protein n=1 Tax=Trachymyrmex septentrionalis TaxID=34720 RepID=A0A151JT68_9HYME|nr:hypothetical protein ALC56_15028 [Trachymyrmex septentrionalis]